MPGIAPGLAIGSGQYRGLEGGCLFDRLFKVATLERMRQQIESGVGGI